MRPSTDAKPAILCVDDEPNVLEGLSLHLRRRFTVTTATSGAAALQILAADRTIAVIISDMQMPLMNGAAFLAKARQVSPDATRMLLTGHAELDSAIAAVNEGNIFRFLTKPCPPTTVLAAVEAAAEQYRLVTAERVLLEDTLRGSIRALTDTLALTNPVSFGKGMRIQRRVAQLCEAMGVPDRWQAEVAAMLSQLGFILLPPEVAERVYYGKALRPEEQAMLARVPAATQQLLANIPRLEGVREMIGMCERQRRKPTAERPASAVEQLGEILRVATDLDALEAQDPSGSRAFDMLRGRGDRYDPLAIGALEKVLGTGAREEIREVPVGDLRKGMVLAEDVKMSNGTLLVTRGYEVTLGFLERIRNYAGGAIKEPVYIFARS
jgi:CheY-like chemotaxis protein